MDEKFTIRVKIVGPNHPHLGETGTIEFRNGTNYPGVGDMYLVKLDNCIQLIEACYATQSQLAILGD